MAANGSTKTLKKRKSITDGNKARKKQSPIDITNEITDQDSMLKASKLQFSYTIGDLKTIEVTGEGFSCKTDNGCTSELTASHLPDVYKLWEFHAHWGTEKDCGSEHLINGKGFSAEEDSVDNENFSPIIDRLSSSLACLSRVNLEPNFDPLKLLPGKLQFYR
uniref:carbonic anhydrase n=1 Tax=Brugia malayi TaxID=6279 RepID=A0A0I9R2P0_BRUMA|nr:BMA-CAH-4 [Brugia malayi]